MTGKIGALFKNSNKTDELKEIIFAVFGNVHTKRIDFELQVEGMGKFDGKVYRVQDNLVRIDLIRRE